MGNSEFKKIVNLYYESSLISRVFEKIDRMEGEMVNWWKDLAKKYSPSGNESKRANYIFSKFYKFGMKDSIIDEEGNVIGIIKGDDDYPSVAFIGTMDDLISIAEKVKNYENEIIRRGEKLIGPGTFITASCVSILVLAKFFSESSLKLRGTVYLVGVVKEEQNFEGIRKFVKDYGDKIDYIIDIFGGYGRINYGALGVKMIKIYFKGPRGHTMTGGLPNVTRAIAKAVDRIYSIPLPHNNQCNESPSFVNYGIGRVKLRGHYLNIAMLHASDVINHKAEDGWFSVDLRSIDNGILDSLFKRIKKVVEEVSKEEKMKHKIEILKDLPAARLDSKNHIKLVEIAKFSTKKFTEDIDLSIMGSTNMNIGIVNQIPSIMLAGNEGGCRDTWEEYGNIQQVIDGLKIYFLIGFILLEGKL